MCQNGTSDVPKWHIRCAKVAHQMCHIVTHQGYKPVNKRSVKETSGQLRSRGPEGGRSATGAGLHRLLRRRSPDCPCSAPTSTERRPVSEPAAHTGAGLHRLLRRRSPDCPCSAAGIQAAPHGLVTAALRFLSPPAICTKHPVLCSRRGRLCGAQRPQNKYFVQFALQPGGARRTPSADCSAALRPRRRAPPDCPPHAQLPATLTPPPRRQGQQTRGSAQEWAPPLCCYCSRLGGGVKATPRRSRGAPCCGFQQLHEIWILRKKGGDILTPV